MTGITQLPVVKQEELGAMSLDPNIHTDKMILDYTKRIDFLVSIIRGLTERSDDDLKDAVSFEVSKLNPLTFDDAVIHIRETYTQRFFQTEYDVDYKVSLCRAILQHMRAISPRYDNPLLESIATRDPNVAELITPIWKREP